MTNLETSLFVGLVAIIPIAFYLSAKARDAERFDVMSTLYFETIDRLASDERIDAGTLEQSLILGRRMRSGRFALAFAIALVRRSIFGVRPRNDSGFTKALEALPEQTQVNLVLAAISGTLAMSYYAPVAGRVIRFVLNRWFVSDKLDATQLPKSSRAILRRHDPHLDGLAPAF
jgi:hypothetical protein